ncbi:exocyst complex subunit 3 [Pelomyxa schiedti]|nr:exocyst complex subunit 3 [Pelomyxa schiedti]
MTSLLEHDWALVQDEDAVAKFAANKASSAPSKDSPLTESYDTVTASEIAAIASNFSSAGTALSALIQTRNVHFLKVEDMTPDQLSEHATEMAANRLKSILTQPDCLDRLPRLRNNAIHRKASLDLRVRAIVKAQLDEAEAALSLIHKSLEQVQKMKSEFETVGKLFEQVQSLMSDIDYGTVKELSYVRTNLHATKRHLLEISSIEKSIEEIKVLLQDNTNIFDAYLLLRKLDNLEQQAMSELNTNDLQEELGDTVRQLFKDVQPLKEDFHEKLFGIIADAIALSKRNPTALVRALEVVLLCDRSAIVEAKQQGLEEPSEDETYFEQAKAHIRNSIEENFSATFDMDLAADINHTISMCNTRVDELTDVLDYLVGCFPPEYNIFELFVTEYSNQFRQRFTELSSDPDKVPNNLILTVYHWVQNVYPSQLLRLGVKAESEALDPPLADTLDPLVDKYVSRVTLKMIEWFGNVIQQDRENPPQEPTGGQLITLSPFDVFEIVNQQLQIAVDTKSGGIVLLVVKGILESLTKYADMQLELFSEDAWKTMPLEYMIVLINNNDKCCELLDDVQTKIGELLTEDDAESIEKDEETNFNTVVKEFQAVVSVSMDGLTHRLFMDVEDTLKQLYEEPWYSGQVIEPVIACLEAYIVDDFTPFMLGPHVTRVAIKMLDKLVICYLQETFSSKHPHKLPLKCADQLDSDINKITVVFQRFCKPNVVSAHLSVVEAIKSIIGSEIDAVPMHFDTLLRAYPDFSVSLIEWLLNRRTYETKEDQPEKNEIADAITTCTEAWATFIRGLKDAPEKGIATALRKGLKLKDKELPEPPAEGE